MLPAIANAPCVSLAAVASRDPRKAADEAATFQCPRACTYDEMIEDAGIDAIYMPLPTGLHEEWVHKALEHGKHLLVEKSLACDFASAKRMLDHARALGLLILENFLFLRHSQFAWARQQLAEGRIGELKFFRAAFTIPPLDAGNFRYDQNLGGGALLDVGAYMVKSSLAFLGPSLEITYASMEHARGVDLRGTAVFCNPQGQIAQTLWGFDTSYQCTWEFIGTEGRILCERALTPPPGFEPPVHIESGGGKQDLRLPADNHYVNQWEFFATAVRNPASIPFLLDEAQVQAATLAEVKRRAGVGRGQGVKSREISNE